jgi:C1A family cysteine protease
VGHSLHRRSSSRRYGLRPSNALHPMVLRARTPTVPAGPLPPSMDLTALFAGIRNQGAEGSCTGMSTAACREILWGSKHGSILNTRLSPAYLYARTRIAEGSFPADRGASMADEFAVLQAFGVCPEKDMPYDEDPTEMPGNVADVAAVAFRCGTPCSVDMTDPTKAKTVLAAGMPIGIGVPVYDSFEHVGPDGVLPIPDPTIEALLGGHGLCLAGYDEARGCYRGINSWGEGWGDKGFFWMPYDYPIWEGWTALKG